ncbi:S8 family serine peptidase [Phycicoccus sp. CSK15P-2]|uniref:S8 family serine peptidase n=1 Tax=Phycicoccus sp. CSK15P-2 TaxID=2807627 RepID=UPI00194F2E83|nr:S8 family serine peptidase [Phycicoccus sp. CSK15P-2]MBM6406013.1 S8 family serine peptidase [Phycicoccus sp. CSK15P-2]
MSGEGEMSKLDEVLLRAISEHQRRSAARTGPGSGSGSGSAETAKTATDEPATVELFVEFTGSVDGLTTLGFHPQSVRPVPQHGLTVAAGWMPVEALPRLQGADQVIRATGARPVSPQLDQSLGEVNADRLHMRNPALRGAGVVIGIIDEGIDLYHPTFRNPDGTSRMLAVWDMRNPPRPGESPPAKFEGGEDLIGVEYRKDRDGVLAAPPYRAPFPLTDDPNNHGTHVAGIAAGNGRGSPAGTDYTGMAPEADLVVVCVGRSPKDVTWTNAFEYILREAKERSRPVVINLSMGRRVEIGERGGPNTLEKWISAALNKGGRAVVVAAGKMGLGRAKARPGDRDEGELARVGFSANAGARLQLEFEGDLDSLRGIRIEGPGGKPTDNLSVEGYVTHDVKVDNTDVHVDRFDPILTIVLKTTSTTTPSPGNWAVTFEVEPGRIADIDGWYVAGHGAFIDHFHEKETVMVPARIDDVIAVGNCNLRRPHQSEIVVDQSSRGPVPGSQNGKPDLVAPGIDIMASVFKGRTLAERPLWGRKSGTSMAAPHVAGVVALLLQEHSTANHVQLGNWLRAAARPPRESNGRSLPGFDRYEWGHGILDAASAMARLRRDLRTPSGTTSTAQRGSLRTPAGTGEQSEATERTTPGDLRTLWAALATAADHRAGRPSLARWAARISRHLAELERLLTHQPTLASHWHQADGPALLRWLTHTLTGGPDHPEPPDPATLTEHLDALLTELEHVGSPRLRRDATRCRHELATIPPTTLTVTLTTHPPHTAGQHR